MIIGGAFDIVAASIFAGVVQHAALHPLDTLKVRLQYAQGDTMTRGVRGALGEALKDLELPKGMSKKTQAELAREFGRRPNGGIWSAPLFNDIAGAAKIIRSTKLMGLYRGLMPSLLAVIPTAVVYMPTYEFSSAALKSSGFAISAIAPLAGVATGIVCATVRVPASVLKSRVQLGLSPNTGAALRTALASGGVPALYAGFGATLALDVATAVVQFSALDGLRRYSPKSSNAAVGFVASALATTLTEPIDVVRTRLMAAIKGKEDRFKYRSLFDGLSKAWKTEGAASLYRGLLPRLLLKSLGGAIWYSTYMWARNHLAPAVNLNIVNVKHS